MGVCQEELGKGNPGSGNSFEQRCRGTKRKKKRGSGGQQPKTLHGQRQSKILREEHQGNGAMEAMVNPLDSADGEEK